MKKITFLMLLLLTATGATVRYISPNGSSVAPYTSWTTAADSIQKCLDICQYGDTIYIGDGEYTGHFIGGSGLTIIGSGIDNCILSDNYYGSEVEYILTLGYKCNISNITFKGQKFQHICGVCSEDSCKYESNKFINNFYGLLLQGTNFIKNNFFKSIQSVSILTFSPKGKIEIINNYFDDGGNQAINNAAYSTLLIARNNIFHLQQGEAVYSSTETELYNNLIISHDTLGRARFFYHLLRPNKQINNVAIGWMGTMPGSFVLDSLSTIKNNIAIDNVIGFGIMNDDGPIKNFGHNNSYNNYYNYMFTADSTNLSVDPMFVNNHLDSADVHLQAFSPMIDMGDPTIKDIDGTRSDIGLYGGPYGEEYLYADLAPKTPKNVAIALWENKAIIHWNVNTEADFSRYRIYKDTVKGFTIDSSKILMDITATEIGIDTLLYSGKNTYFKVAAIDKQGHISRPSEEVALLLNDVNEPNIKEESFVLYPAYPNPFNPSTRISYKMKDRGYVKLQIYTIQGELVSTLVEKEQPSGYYETDFTGKNLNNSKVASGVYLYRLEIKNSNHQPVFIDMKKMIFLK